MKSFEYEGYDEENNILKFVLTTNYSFKINFIGNVIDGFIPKISSSIPFSYFFGDSKVTNIKVENDKIYIYVNNKALVLDIDNNVLDIVDLEGNSTIDSLAMYSNQAMYNNYYGGFQGSLYFNFDKYIEDTYIKKLLKKYTPKVIYTYDDLELLFYQFYKDGCGFIAGGDAILSATMNLSDEEFYEKFGYPRYRVEIIDDIPMKVCNYDYVSFDLYLRYNNNYDRVVSEVGKKNNDNKKPLINTGKDLDKGVFGSNLSELIPCIIKFLQERDIKANGSVANYEVGSYLRDNQLDDALDKGNKVLLSIYGFDLYYPIDVNKNGKFDDLYKQNFGGHIVEVIENAGNGKYVISSWGKKYLDTKSNILGIVNELLSVNNTDITNLGIIEF